MAKKKSAVQKKYRPEQWFYSVRGSYLPRTWQAWALYVPYVFVLVSSFLWARHAGGSYTDQAFKVFPVWVATAVVMTWIAKSRS